MHTLLFNIYATLALTAGIGVISSKNPIHSVIFLILVFCNATGLLLLFKIELLAMMFIIIYVGAIAVLFLFVVMMLNIKVNQPTAYKIIEQNHVSYAIKEIIKTPLVLMGLISIIIFLSLSFILDNGWDIITTNNISITIEQMNKIWLEHNQQVLQKPWILIAVPATNIQTLGYLIYTYYFYYFIMASLILMIAMIGAIVLTMYKRKITSKKQQIYKQVARNFETAVILTN